MAFDPYESWLGIPADRRPPSHYELLGLALFESDPAAIERAALWRMSRVRQHQLGPHGDLSQEILAELARARLILMDPDRRAEYDETLRARAGRSRAIPGPESTGADRPSRRRAGAGDCVVLPPIAVTVDDDGGRASLRSSPKPAHRRSRSNILAWSFTAANLVSLGAIYQFVLLPAMRERPISITVPPRPTGPGPIVVKPPPRAPFPNPVNPGPKAPWPDRTQGSNAGKGQPPATPPPAVDGMAPDDGDDESPEDTTAPPAKRREAQGLRRGPEAILKEHGLSRAGALYVLREDEDAVFEAEARAQGLKKSLADYRRQWRETMGPDQRQQFIREQEFWIREKRREIETANLRMEQFPRFRGQFYNNAARQEFEMIRAYRDGLRTQIPQAEADLDQFRNLPFDPQAKQRLADSIRETEASFEQAVREVHTLADDTIKKYEAFDQDDGVRRAIHALGKDVKLGPTPRLNQAARSFENPRQRKAERPPRR